MHHGAVAVVCMQVEIRNVGSAVVQMLTRHWVFVDSATPPSVHEVKGPGARGVMKVLQPGEKWVYHSGTSLATATGSMHGSMQFIVRGNLPRGEDRQFSVRLLFFLGGGRGGGSCWPIRSVITLRRHMAKEGGTQVQRAITHLCTLQITCRTHSCSSDVAAPTDATQAVVGRLGLTDADGVNVNVPCVPETDFQKIPCTSVWVTLASDAVRVGDGTAGTGTGAGAGMRTGVSTAAAHADPTGGVVVGITTERADTGLDTTATDAFATAFHYVYDIQVNNNMDTPIEIVGHAWKIRDANGVEKRPTGGGPSKEYQGRTLTIPANGARRYAVRTCSPSSALTLQTLRLMPQQQQQQQQQTHTRARAHTYRHTQRDTQTHAHAPPPPPTHIRSTQPVSRTAVQPCCTQVSGLF